MHPPAEQQPLKSRALLIGKKLLVEIHAIARETADQTARLVLLGYGYVQLVLLRFRADQALVAFGRRLVETGKEDESRHDELRLLNKQIQTARARVMPNPLLELRRRRLLMQVGSMALEQQPAPGGTEAEHRMAQQARLALKTQRERTQSAKQKLLPTSQAIWRRVGIGYVVILCLFVLLIPRGTDRADVAVRPSSSDLTIPGGGGATSNVPFQPDPENPQTPPGPTANRQKPEPGPDDPLDVSSVPEIDERLFLVRTIEALYSQLPSPDLDRTQLVAALVRLRGETNRNCSYVEGMKIDSDVVSLHKGFLALLDEYQKFLVDTGRIRVEDLEQADRDLSDNIFGAISTAGSAGSVAAKRTGNPWVGGGVAVIAGAGKLVWSFSASSQDRDERKREKENSARQTLLNSAQNTVSQAQGRVASMANALSWPHAEAGFEASDDQMKKAFELAQRGDARELIRQAEIAVRRRPRDPFALTALSGVRSAYGETSTSPDGLLAEAKNCVAAARLVPANAFYDGYRARFLATAGVMANSACRLQIGEKGWIAGSTPAGREAVRIWRTYSAFDPYDRSGMAREQLSLALANAGRHKDAKKSAGEVARLREKSADYAYNYACLLSITDSTEQSFRWLRQAFDNGFENISWARNDPDLAAMRKDRASDFKALSKVDLYCDIEWHYFLGDVIKLTNRSAFPVSDVKLDLTVRSEGYEAWNESFSARRIDRYATVTWPATIKARGKDPKPDPRVTCVQDK